MKNLFTTKKLAALGMLAALSIVLALLVRFPIIPTAPFLEYDAADIPIFLGGFLYGPFAGLLLTVVVSVIQGTTVSFGSGGVIGILMHIFATGSYVLVAGFFYRYKRTMKGAIIAMLLGSVVMVATMIVWNIIFTPIFMGVPKSVVLGMILPAILPFNVIKVVINSTATLILYKRVQTLFRFILKEPKTCETKVSGEQTPCIKEDETN
jgi:riboflavin transporter FmnP